MYVFICGRMKLTVIQLRVLQRRHDHRGKQRGSLAPGCWKDTKHGGASTTGRRGGPSQGSVRRELRGERTPLVRNDPAAATDQGATAATAGSVQGKLNSIRVYFARPRKKN